MPRISVVVPIYQVEPYLDACLRSLQEQTISDFEAILVDDGSTDGSGAIAARYADRDARFRLIRQPNGGLGHARNTGIDAASGDYLAFLDSDDMLPPDAYRLLLSSLQQTGSDFATGNIHRFTSERTWPARFLARTFWCSRRRTHVTRFRWLLSDRMAQNKLWRRAFWERHGLRFPEGAYHEDIPVVIPAHFLAGSVDVLRQPVYLYREREDGVRSITQRRTDPRVLRDRVDAVERAGDFLAQHAPLGSKRAYDERVLAEDLLYHLDVFEQGGEAYREQFLDRAGAFLARAGDGAEDRLPAIQRLKWHLVRRRLTGELLEVLRFQREELASAGRRIVGGRAYGAYPFLDDPGLKIPRSVYRLDTLQRRTRHATSLVGVAWRPPRLAAAPPPLPRSAS